MFFVKNTTEERRRKLQGEKRKQQAVCKTYVFFGTKSFASSRAFSCTKTRERKTAAGIATYWQLTIHKNRPLYISVPLRLLSWCSKTKVKVNETNDGTRKEDQGCKLTLARIFEVACFLSGSDVAVASKKWGLEGSRSFLYILYQRCMKVTKLNVSSISVAQNQ